MNRQHLTPEGYEQLAADLRRQKEVVRPGIVKDIEEARAHGDISENSEYEDAKERQSMCEGRIAYLENLLAAAEIVDITKIEESDKVVFGCTVVLEDSESGEVRTWRIVGESEADVDGGRISYVSPIGKAMIGREEGEEVLVQTPQGPRKWEIVEVRYVGPDQA